MKEMWKKIKKGEKMVSKVEKVVKKDKKEKKVRVIKEDGIYRHFSCSVCFNWDVV